MRYSLASLLTAITLFAAGLGMYVPYGWLGILLLAPHLLTLFGVWWFVKRGKWLIAGIVFSLYATSWSATAFFGIPQVHEDVRSQIWSGIHNHRFGELKEVDHDPILESVRFNVASKIKPPWYFVGNGFSPCPFVLTVDYGINRGGLNGEGYRLFHFWCFGFRKVFSGQFLWSS